MNADVMNKIWNNAYFDAIGCGESIEFAEKYANAKIAPMIAAQKKAEFWSKHPNGIAKPNQAGQRQRKELRASYC